MMTKRAFILIIFNILGFTLFFSWYLPVNHGIWFNLDKQIFYWFNDQLTTNTPLLWVIAVTNFRAFDGVALLAMGLLYFSIWRNANHTEKWQMVAIGITMLISAVTLNQLGHLMPVPHGSPTTLFPNVNHVSQLVGIATKDTSSDSFPGDHGMLLMIFASYMLRYFSLRTFTYAVIIVLVFSAPRIMIGAHWFTDVAVGSLSIVLVGMSWWLLTPLSDTMIRMLCRLVLFASQNKKDIA